MANNRVISAVLSLEDRGFSSGLRRAGESTEDFERRLQSSGNQVTAFGRSAVKGFKTVVVAASALAGTGVAAFGVAVGKTIGETESAFSKLEAQTGLSGKELEVLGKTATEVFKKGYGDSVSQVTNDLGMLKQTLGTVDDKTLESTQILSAMNESMDLDSTARALRSMTSAFPGATQQQSLDIITKTLQVGGDSSGDLLDSFNEYSGVIASAGIGMDSFANIMVNGAKSGARNYDVVADTLKEFNILTKTGSDDTKAAFKTLGMDADKVASDLASGGKRGEQAYFDTMGALSKLDDKAKYSVGVALMGTKFEDLEAKAIEGMGTSIDLLGDYEGATQKAGDSIRDNFSVRVVSAWRDIKVSASEAFKDAGGGELLEVIAAKAEELVPKIEELVTSAIDFGKKVHENWGTIVKVITPIGSAIGTVYAILGAVGVWNMAVGAMNLYKGSAFATTFAQHGLNAAMKANPIGFVITAIALLVGAGVALYQNWDTVVAKTQEVWGKMKEAKGVIGFVIDPIRDLIQTGLDLANNWDSTRGVWDNVWNLMKLSASDAVNSVIGGVNSLIKTINKIPGVDIPLVATVNWGDTKSTVTKTDLKAKGPALASFAVGTNRVRSDMVANIHKDEMIIPARQSQNLRNQGVTIDNIDKPSARANTTSNNSRNSGGLTVIIENIHAKGTTARELVDELVPQIKLRMANM